MWLVRMLLAISKFLGDVQTEILDCTGEVLEAMDEAQKKSAENSRKVSAIQADASLRKTVEAEEAWFREFKTKAGRTPKKPGVKPGTKMKIVMTPELRAKKAAAGRAGAKARWEKKRAGLAAKERD